MTDPISEAILAQVDAQDGTGWKESREPTFGQRTGLPLETVILLLILVVGGVLRLSGLNWDDGHWLHPDERKIYFVTEDLGWPGSLGEALTPRSPLNPGFFAYGSLSFYLLKAAAVLLTPLWPALRDPGNLHLLGRLLAALADLGTVYLTYRLGCALYPTRLHGRGLRGRPLFGAALVSLAVLHVQLAHFFSADILLTLAVMLSLNLAAGVARGGGRWLQLALGAAFGLALAIKISAAPLLLSVLAAHYAGSPDASSPPPISSSRPSICPIHSRATRLQRFRGLLLTLATAAVVLVVVQPYALIDWRTFLADTLRESQIGWGTLDVPYSRQYVGMLPYLYPIWQTALWGMALPVGLLAWSGFLSTLVRWLRRGSWPDTLLLSFACPYLAVVGLLHTHYLRYMLPLIPVLCLMAAGLLGQVQSRRLRSAAYWGLGLSAFAYVAAFAGVYAGPHPWIQASEWIYEHVPGGSVLAVEEWDTPLPLPLEVGTTPRRIEEYGLRSLDLYREPDDAAKWAELAAALAESDYLILASHRLYGSISRLPERYPVAGRYYDLLLAGDLGFKLVGEFTRGPKWFNPRIPPQPGAGPASLRPDESFVVYDHPRTLILHNTARLSASELLDRLGLLETAHETGLQAEGATAGGHGLLVGVGRSLAGEGVLVGVSVGGVSLGQGAGVSVGRGDVVGVGVSLGKAGSVGRMGTVGVDVGRSVGLGVAVQVAEGVGLGVSAGVGVGFWTQTQVRASLVFPQRSKTTTLSE